LEEGQQGKERCLELVLGKIDAGVHLYLVKPFKGGAFRLFFTKELNNLKVSWGGPLRREKINL